MNTFPYNWTRAVFRKTRTYMKILNFPFLLQDQNQFACLTPCSSIKINTNPPCLFNFQLWHQKATPSSPLVYIQGMLPKIKDISPHNNWRMKTRWADTSGGSFVGKRIIVMYVEGTKRKEENKALTWGFKLLYHGITGGRIVVGVFSFPDSKLIMFLEKVGKLA